MDVVHACYQSTQGLRMRPQNERKRPRNTMLQLDLNTIIHSWPSKQNIQRHRTKKTMGLFGNRQQFTVACVL